MSATIEQLPAAQSKLGGKKWVAWLPLAALALLWLDLCRQLSYTWETNEQYAYGWFVPLLALGLLIKKWPSRPGSEIRSQKSEVSSPSPGGEGQGEGDQVSHPPSRIRNAALTSSDPRPLTSDLRPLTSGNTDPRRLPIFFLVLIMAAALLPLRVIFEINQDWPLISWLYTLIVVALTLYAFHLAGPSPVASTSAFRFHPSSLFSPWVRHFFFPICFILIAVQWPYRIENLLTKGLMRLDTNVTVELLGWFGIPAVQHGNVIELATGTVGVNEACSGIRSFQSTFMAALFLGELYLLRWRIRLLLVGVGLSAAFLFNVIRTFILSYQANQQGIGAIDKWHDPAGFTITVACFLCLWAIAVLIRKRWSTAEPQPSAFIPHPSEPPPQLSPFIPHPSPDTPHPSENPPQPSAFIPSPSVSGPQVSGLIPHPCFGFRFHPSARAYMCAVGAWALLAIAATEAWYRGHDIGRAETVRWWVNFPTNSPSFSPLPVSDFARKLLKYDEGATASWEESDGTKWSVFCFRWRAGEPTARMSAMAHRPEHCMTGSGHQMNAELGTRYLPANGLKLPFRAYIFDAPERPLHVFFCLWEDGAEQQRGFARTKYHDRLRGALEGRRGLGQQTLEIICSGYEGIEQAQAAVTARLPELIKVETAR